MGRLFFTCSLIQEIGLKPKENLAHSKAIVSKGIQRPLSHLEERLKQLEEDRKDSILPALRSEFTNVKYSVGKSHASGGQA